MGAFLLSSVCVSEREIVGEGGREEKEREGGKDRGRVMAGEGEWENMGMNMNE